MTAKNIVWYGFEGVDEARQWQVQPDGRIRVEVKFGDKDPRYSESRALKSAQDVWFVEGVEPSIAKVTWTTEIPAGFIQHYPKQDELYAWPDIGLGACSILEWHDAPGQGPPMNGDWSKLPSGGAPIYTGIGPEGHYLILPDPTQKPAQGYLSFSTPLEPGKKNTHVMQLKMSSKPTIGWMEYSINGIDLLGGRFPCMTMFPNTDNYLLIGVYSRLSIGDPKLLWQTDAKPGVVYPNGFTPKKGSRVYVKDDGYPRAILIGDATIETSSEGDVIVPTPPVPPTPPTPPAPPVPPAPVARPGGLQQLIDQVPLLQTALTQAQEMTAKAQAVSVALSKAIADTVKLLNKGEHWND